MPDAVVIQWARLGDVLQTRPLIDALKTAYDRVYLSVDRRYQWLAAQIVGADNVWPVELAKWHALAGQPVSHPELIGAFKSALGQWIGVQSPDVYNLTRSFPAAVVGDLLNPREVYGYRFEDGKLVVPETVRRLEDGIRKQRVFPVHLADCWRNLPPVRSSARWPVPLSVAGRENGRENPVRTIAFVCDAGSRDRQIPEAWLCSLIEETAQSRRVKILLTGMTPHHSGDSLSAAVKSGRGAVSDFRGRTGLEELTRLFRNADLVIGSDTGALHLASSVGTETLGLFFGGAHCLNTGPYAPASRVVQVSVWDDVLKRFVAKAAEQASIRQPHRPDDFVDNELWKPELDKYGVVYRSVLCPDDDNKSYNSVRRSFFEGGKEYSVSAAMKTDTKAVSIIIPECGGEHYTEELLAELLPSLQDLDHEVIIVSSGTRKQGRSGGESVRVISSERRLSFAEACNLGASDAKQPWLFFLNNDVQITGDAVCALLEDAAADVIVSPRIFYPDGVVQNLGVSFRNGSVEEIGHGVLREQMPPGEPDAVSAVAMLLSEEVFRKLGGFDEVYKNGYEDLDLCLRAREYGIKSVICKQADVIHYRGSTEGRYAKDSENLQRFRERWRITDKKSIPFIAENRNKSITPLVIVSAESDAAAGSLTRWIWMLEEAGLARDRDFQWLRVDLGGSNAAPVLEVLKQAKVIVVFRPLMSDLAQAQVMEAVQKNPARLIVDSDDLVLNRFPAGSERARKWASYENRFRNLLNAADVITASTEPLAETLCTEGFRTLLLPTRPRQEQNCELWNRGNTGGEIRIAFMGSSSHLLDLGSILPALERILDAYADVRLFWWGCRPGELAYHPQVRQGGPFVKDYRTHLYRLCRFPLDLAVVPMVENKVSRVKTPIKYFDYSLAGVPAVYSNSEPYRSIVENEKTGLLADESTGSWIQAIQRLIEDQVLRKTLADNARDHVLSMIKDQSARAEEKEFVETSLLSGNRRRSADKYTRVRPCSYP